MDILTHTVSGAFAGVLISSYSNFADTDKIKLIIFGAIAGFLPDIDVITMWSGFDETIGKFFNLTQSGKEIYSDKLWYSHHSLSHSFTIISIYLIILSIFTKKTPYFITFFLAYSIHLFEDLPTPDRIWQGVRLFYPNDTYYGGYSYIWWWNNYDIFLIISISFLISFFILFFDFKYIKIIISIIFISSLFLTINQIRNRNINFSYSTQKEHKILEKKSLELQKNILGNKIFKIMRKFDKKIKIPF